MRLFGFSRMIETMLRHVFKAVQVYPVTITSVILIKNKIVQVIKLPIYPRWKPISKTVFPKQLENYLQSPAVSCQAFRYPFNLDEKNKTLPISSESSPHLSLIFSCRKNKFLMMRIPLGKNLFMLIKSIRPSMGYYLLFDTIF